MSQIYYHVDRKNELSQGDVMEYVTSLDGIDLLEEEYPKGFTRHGWLYFTKHPHDFAVVEWFLEFIRLMQYSTKPSRTQSIFAFESLEEAYRFIEDSSVNQHDDTETVIWKVEAETHGHKGEMKTAPGDIDYFFQGLNHAIHYWNGESLVDDPHWEVLLSPPVHVIEQVG